MLWDYQDLDAAKSPRSVAPYVDSLCAVVALSHHAASLSCTDPAVQSVCDQVVRRDQQEEDTASLSPISTATETRTSLPKSVAPYRPTAMPCGALENPGQSNDSINVRLVGVKTNRAAIGTRITLAVENAGQAGDLKARSIHRAVGSGGSFGANPMELHVGLGPSAHIKKVEVWWPASNTFQRFSDGPERTSSSRFREFAERYTKLERKAVRLGGKESGRRERQVRADGLLSCLSSARSCPFRPCPFDDRYVDRSAFCKPFDRAAGPRPGDFQPIEFVDRPRPRTSRGS